MSRPAGRAACRSGAILFDLDDTLFDHRYASASALAATRSQYAPLQALDAGEAARVHAEVLEVLHLAVLRGEISIEEARIERFLRLFRAAGHDAGRGEATAAARSYRETYRAAWRAVPGAPALLARLSSETRIGIVSNNVRSEQEEKLQACGLARFVELLVVSSDEGIMKPDPAIFHRALERLGCDPDAAAMVGDSWEVDVIGAQRAGLRAVWFNPARRQPPERAAVTEVHAWEPAAGALARLLAP